MLECLLQKVYGIELHLEVEDGMSMLEAATKALHDIRDLFDMEALIHDPDTMGHIQLQFMATILQNPQIPWIR